MTCDAGCAAQPQESCELPGRGGPVQVTNVGSTQLLPMLGLLTTSSNISCCDWDIQEANECDAEGLMVHLHRTSTAPPSLNLLTGGGEVF